MLNIKSVPEAVELLGNMSPNDIAEFFRSQGIKGQLKNAKGCPISNWIFLLFNQRAVVGNNGLIHIMNVGTWQVPQSITDFNIKFDNHEFEFLIEETKK